MSVAVLTDDGATLAPGLAPGLVVVTTSEPACDADGPLATTAPVPVDLPTRFASAIEACDKGDGVVLVTVGSRLSGTFGAARLACHLVDGAHQVRLIDSSSATVGEGHVVLAALRAAAEGAALDAVAQNAELVAQRVRVTAQIASAAELVRGGRVPAAAAYASRLAGLRPLFELVDGQVRTLRPAFSQEAAEGRVVAALRATVPAGARLHVAALHADEPESARRLIDAVRALGEPASSFVAELTPAMLAHTGPGVSGLGWWWEVDH